MLGWAVRLFSQQRDLRMVWVVARDGRRSLIVGSAQFFPYHFRGALRRLIGSAGTVLLEGPLDEASMRRVVDAGAAGIHLSLYHALDARTRLRICRMLGLPGLPLEANVVYWQQLFGRPGQWLEAETRGRKPWLAFFELWTRFRSQQGGTYSVELDAARTAAQLGKELRHLETIDEQIATLDAIPLERIVHFMASVEWRAYYEDYVRRYLAGDLDGLIEAARVFPTFCDAVIERRDPVLAERMLPALEQGGACAFIGVTHCPGVLARLQAHGYTAAPFRP